MNQENQMNIEIKEFYKFNEKILLSKTRMSENVRFPILKAERKTTKVGESIALELEEHILYMPERYTSLQDDINNDIVDGKFNIRKSNDNLYLDYSAYNSCILKQILLSQTFAKAKVDQTDQLQYQAVKIFAGIYSWTKNKKLSYDITLSCIGFVDSSADKC